MTHIHRGQDLWFSALSRKLWGTGHPWPLMGTLRSQLLVLSRQWGHRSLRKCSRPTFVLPSAHACTHSHPCTREHVHTYTGLHMRYSAGQAWAAAGDFAPLLCRCIQPSWGALGSRKAMSQEGPALALGGPHPVPCTASCCRLVCVCSGLSDLGRGHSWRPRVKEGVSWSNTPPRKGLSTCGTLLPPCGAL